MRRTWPSRPSSVSSRFCTSMMMPSSRSQAVRYTACTLIARASPACASTLASAAHMAIIRTSRPLELKLKGPPVVEDVLRAVVRAAVLFLEVVLLDVVVRVQVHAHVVAELARDGGPQLI